MTQATTRHSDWIGTLNGEWAAAAIPRSVRIWIVVGLTAVVAGAVLTRPPIPQVQSYNDFADQRTLLATPNLLDTASNLPFLFVGALGLGFVCRQRASNHPPAFVYRAETWPYLLLFFGTALTCLGSGYYHLAPDDNRLMWDRLPMALVFMSFFSATIAERIDVRAGLRLLLPLVVLGLGSVVYWHMSELRTIGGDLRLYVEVQYYPMLAIPLIGLLFPPRYTRSGFIWGVFGLYGLSKAFELLDAQILALGHIVSGHTLKHLAAAAALYYILRTLEGRRPLEAKPAPTQNQGGPTVRGRAD
jgi:hypothetical protein